MRKHQQKLLLDLLRTINEAQSANLYAECQDAAKSIIKFIENIEGDGTQTVMLLNQYYELLFKVFNREVDKRHLTDCLHSIKESIINELSPSKIEVVFLCYKASMSDSFESIYFAAKEDPNCDVYFIPIPFYEINSDGTLGQMHCEGSEHYSNNIEITNWMEYDIEARHPDVIFIQYPYDDKSKNATVHPIFYSERIKKFCRLLIYIPYFVSIDDNVGEYNIHLPGVLNANHVIVQSEAVRNSFINHYNKLDSEYELNNYFGKAKDKFIALGSPKFDKVINSKYDDFNIPLSWKKLIYKPNGEKKKIILYNTHMFTWINSGRAYFNKIYSVFDMFKNRDDVVLWWRPHPNTELNFRTQRPKMLDDYLNLVEKYKNEAWGIYDDTDDLHRALAVSDAYYGDNSSLLIMYNLTKKPALVQNVSCKTNINDLSIEKNNFFINLVL